MKDEQSSFARLSNEFASTFREFVEGMEEYSERKQKISERAAEIGAELSHFTFLQIGSEFDAEFQKRAKDIHNRAKELHRETEQLQQLEERLLANIEKLDLKLEALKDRKSSKELADRFGINKDLLQELEELLGIEDTSDFFEEYVLEVKKWVDKLEEATSFLRSSFEEAQKVKQKHIYGCLFASYSALFLSDPETYTNLLEIKDSNLKEEKQFL